MALVVRDRARSGLGLPACRSGRRGLLCAARFLDVAGLRFGELASIACRSARVSTGTSVSLNRATDWPASPIPERSRGAARLWTRCGGCPGWSRCCAQIGTIVVFTDCRAASGAGVEHEER